MIVLCGDEGDIASRRMTTPSFEPREPEGMKEYYRNMSFDTEHG